MSWEAHHKLLDPEDNNDWMLDCTAEFIPARDEPLLQLRAITT
jgi:hypothetical protein